MIEQENTLTAQKAAKYLGISEAALRLWCAKGKGPRFFRKAAAVPAASKI